MRSRSPHQGGLSSIEAVTVIAFLAMATLGLVHSLAAGQGGLRHIEDDSRTLHQAQILMSRLTTIPFGTPGSSLGAWMASQITISPRNRVS